MALFALPAGIIGAGLAIRVEEEERNRQRKKKKMAAIVLIQCIWRCYKANHNNSYISPVSRNKQKSLFILDSFERIAIQFIRTTKFFIAKSKFKFLSRRFDVKNAFDSYRLKQTDLQNKVKHIQNAIDFIDTKVGVNENRINSQSNLISRIEKIDSMISDIENSISRQLAYIDQFSESSVFRKSSVNFLKNSSKRSINQ